MSFCYYVFCFAASAQVNQFSSEELHRLFACRADTTRSDTHDTLRCKRCKFVQDAGAEGAHGAKYAFTDQHIEVNILFMMWYIVLALYAMCYAMLCYARMYYVMHYYYRVEKPLRFSVVFNPEYLQMFYWIFWKLCSRQKNVYALLFQTKTILD